jgi:hypothetical protein
MEKEMKLIAEAKQLIDWLDENDILMNLSESDAILLINYMEGHGYQLGLSSDGLIRIDNSSGVNQEETISIDDIIDTACEWNYEMIQNAKENLENAVGMIDYLPKQEYYNGLRADEKTLDKMFEQTCYGKEIYDLAARLAEETIRHLQKTGNLDKAALVVSDAFKDYELGQAKVR